MRDVRLGMTDLEVSTIALGTWSYGGEWGPVDTDAATRTIHRALELGITFFDTAQAYGFGRAEEILADALWSQVDRDEVVIASKGGLRQDGGRLVRDASAAWLREGVEHSLRHLRTDYIDLYQVHWPDPHTSAAETGAVLTELVQKGKIRHIGVSNYDVAQIEELRRFAVIDTLQPPYHLFRREIETDVLPYCAAHGIGVLSYGPLAPGLLGGSMTAEQRFGADDWRSKSPDFAGETFATNLAVVERLKSFAALRGVTVAELATAWTIAHPAVDVVIVGARNPDNLTGSAGAADVKLSEEDMEAIDSIMASAVAVRGPAPEGM